MRSWIVCAVSVPREAPASQLRHDDHVDHNRGFRSTPRGHVERVGRLELPRSGFALINQNRGTSNSDYCLSFGAHMNFAWPLPQEPACASLMPEPAHRKPLGPDSV